MRAIAATIEDYLQEKLRERSHPVCLILDQQRRLTSWSGEPDYYGIGPLTVGAGTTALPSSIGDALGADEASAQVLPSVETANGRVACVHLVPTEGHLAVLLFDESERQDRLAERDQSAKELERLRHEQDRLVDHLRQAHAALEKKNEDLARANRAKSQFIANMSHEFRTPLTSVLGYSRLLREALPASLPESKYLDAVERGGRHLLTLVDNLLDEAGIEAGEVEIRPVPTDLERMFRELLDMIRPLTREKGLDLQIEVPGALPASVLVDELRLRQILINLLGNAAKFTQEGGIRVHAEWHWDELSVAVADTGPGIAQEARTRIFDAFQRGTGGNRPQQKGSGLGLAISRELARRMGGDLVLESSGAQGSCFRVSVPARVSAESPVLPTLGSAIHAGEYPASIVVAEDDPDIRALIELYLDPNHYRVRFAEDGLQAVRMVLEAPPDLVLMDMQMPNMDGVSAIQKLRKEGFDKLIVGLTGASDTPFRTHAETPGCDHCLSKPLDMEHLLATIDRLLGRPPTQPGGIL